MKTMRVMLVMAATSALVAAVPVRAADDEAPRYEKGPVWSFTDIKTKDGHFDDYMKWVSTEWKAQEEALKKAGHIVDYKIYVVDSPRQNEPDIVLAMEYKNMAEFDRSVADEYAFGKQLYGSMEKANKEQADRGSIRTILGETTMRELTLK